MNLAFIYVGAISAIIILLALVNMKSIEAKINDFYKGPYGIEENVLKAQVSMVKIENSIYKAYMTKLEDLCKKYIEESEKDYGILEQSVIKLRKSMTALDMALENITKLEGEIKKGERYRKQIIENANAARTTAELIGNSLNVIKEGVQSADEAAKHFEAIVTKSMKTNEVIEDMSRYSKEQAQQLNETLAYLQHISAIIETNSAASEESSTMSEEFISQSEKLEEMIQQYKIV
jgi:methyl-accepting chemotaxis protein